MTVQLTVQDVSKFQENAAGRNVCKVKSDASEVDATVVMREDNHPYMAGKGIRKYRYDIQEAINKYSSQYDWETETFAARVLQQKMEGFEITAEEATKKMEEVRTVTRYLLNNPDASEVQKEAATLALKLKWFLMSWHLWRGTVTRIYFNGHALCANHMDDGALVNVNPLDYFEHANIDTLSVAFDGSPMYQLLNYDGNGWRFHDALTEFFDGHGYYFEMGNAWNFTLIKKG